MRLREHSWRSRADRKNTRKKILSMMLVFTMCFSLFITAEAAEEKVQEARNSVVRVCSAITIKYYGYHEELFTVVGTGFFVGEEGKPVDTILTNRHLVSAEQILDQVKQLDEKYAKAEIIDDIRVWVLVDGEAYKINYSRNVTLSQIADIAIVKLSKPIENRVPAVIADPDDVDVTDTVYAIGYPGYSDVEDVKNTSDGNYEDTILKLYPSGIDNMSVTQGYVVKTHSVIGGIDHIQHAAAISGGNDGSPLVTDQGTVVGINTMASSENADTSNFAVDSSNLTMFLRQNNISYINAADIQPEPEPEPEDEPEPEAEPEPEPEPEPEQKQTYILYYIGAGVLVLILILILAVRSYKKKKEEEERKRREEEEQKRREEEERKRREEDERKQREEEEKRKKAAMQNLTPEVTIAMPHRGQKIVFTMIGGNGQSVELQLEEGRELWLGRDERSELILNSKDKKLSGKHCLVRCTGGALRVQDGKSTNGTFVNGVPLCPVEGNHIDNDRSVLMREGDILKAGDYEYRIHFAGECSIMP